MPGKAIDLNRPVVVVAASLCRGVQCVAAGQRHSPVATTPSEQNARACFSKTSLRNLQRRMTKGDYSRRNRKFTIAITLIDLLNLKYA